MTNVSDWLSLPSGGRWKDTVRTIRLIDPTKRSTREDVLRSRAALQIVRPLQREVGAWQAEIARMITRAERSRLRHEHDIVAQQRVAVLERTIREARGKLTEQLGELPDDVREHDRVVDIYRAIDSALAGLDQAQRLTD